MKYSLFCLMALALCFTACDKNDNDTDLPPGCTLQSVTYTYENTPTHYTLNYSNGLIHKVERNEETMLLMYDNSQLVQVLYSAWGVPTGRVDIAYTGTQKSFDWHWRGNKKVVKNEYLYTAGKVSRVNTYNMEAADTTIAEFYTNYEYDAAGNITSQWEYHNLSGTDTLLLTKNYQYDDKVNPFSSPVFAYIGLPGSTNNVIREEKDFACGDPFTITTTYTYNSDGYPTSYEAVWDKGPVENFTYDYNCR